MNKMYYFLYVDALSSTVARKKFNVYSKSEIHLILIWKIFLWINV